MHEILLNRKDKKTYLDGALIEGGDITYSSLAQHICEPGSML